MKLQKALKIKKNLIGEINKIKSQIKAKNSYISGSNIPQKYDIEVLNQLLLDKVSQLVTLKYMINQANSEIQDKIYVLAENKSLIEFWKEVSVAEGMQTVGYNATLTEYKVQFDEVKRDEIVSNLQKKVDVLQEEIDSYNFTTDIPDFESDLVTE